MTRDDAGDRPGDQTAALPVVGGAEWFDTEDRPFVLRIDCPLSFDEMVAAIYGVGLADEIDSDDGLCGVVAVILVTEGLPGLQERAAKIRRAERRGLIEAPDFLALCRQRVAALLVR